MRRALAVLAAGAALAAGSVAWRIAAPTPAAPACSASAALSHVRLGEIAGSLDPSDFMATVVALGHAPPGYLRMPVAMRTPALADVLARYEADPRVLARACAAGTPSG